MTFSVEPDDMRTYAARLLDLSGDAVEGSGYAHRYGDLGVATGGIFGAVLGSHSEFMTRLDEMFTQLQKLTEGNHRSLNQIAEEYESVDRRSASAIDASYPMTQRPIVHEG